MKISTFPLIIFLISHSNPQELKMSSYTMIGKINQQRSSWTACENFPEDVNADYLKRLGGVIDLHPDANYQLGLKEYQVDGTFIPEFFDSRNKWPICKDVISHIRHQGNCGSCWAFAPAEVMSDRHCIKSNGTIKFQYSPEDILECCENCASASDKCFGGYPGAAFEYWKNEGVVSGGDYESHSGCKPYNYSAFWNGIVPECQQQCRKNYQTSYKNDKKFGSSVYKIASHEQQIQIEIMTNGPVVAIFDVYQDFFYYSHGVYRHFLGGKVSRHAVKIVGWGKEYNIKYWLVANSWGSKWGTLGGFFKIVRGENHCGIEENVIAGISSAVSIYISHKILLFLVLRYILM